MDTFKQNDEAMKTLVCATSQSTNINTGATTITSGDSTNITTAVENDYSYSFNQSKTPSIGAALSNAVVQMANAMMPSFGHKSSDNTQSNSKTEDLVYDQDKQKTETTTSANIASNINSTGNLNITSQNNTLIKGSNLSANNIALTTTTGTTTITSAQDQVSRSIESVSQSYNNTSAEYNRGRASVDSNSKVEEITTTTNTITQKQSNITAANNITITSNQDLNILSSNLAATAGSTTLNSQEGNVNILALQNTTTTSTETRVGTLTLSAGVGNSAIDTAS